MIINFQRRSSGEKFAIFLSYIKTPLKAFNKALSGLDYVVSNGWTIDEKKLEMTWKEAVVV